MNTSESPSAPPRILTHFVHEYRKARSWKLRLTSELRSAIPRILTRFARKYVAVGLVWMMVGSLVLNAIVMFAGNGGIAAVSGAKLDSIGKSVVGSKTASVTWSSPTQITHGAWESGSAYMHPDVFVDGVNICAVWMDGRDNQNLDYDLYFISSLNGGASWQTEKRISTYGEYSSDPVVVANNGMVHVFVEDQGTLWYIYSSDMVLWSNKSLISADKSIEDYKVAMSGMMLYFVWSERVDLYNFDIYLLKSTDLGETWSAEFKIASIYSASTHCRLEIATSSEKLYVVSDGGFIRSDDGGSSWGSFNSSLNGCHVKANGQYVHIMKGTAYGYEGYARSEDFGNTWSTVNTTIKGKIAAPGNYVYVVNGSQYFLSTNNGISFGDANTIPSISPVSPYCTSVDVSPSGRAHVVYEGWVSGEGHTEIFYVHSVISHAPIYINGNAGFTAENGVSNPGAAGTADDPYIIENWDINASSANGIEIRNTDKYFIIRSCVIHDGIPNYHGIYFYNVTYGKIENVTSYNNDEGIYLFSSSDNNLTNCRISSGYIGIHLQDYSSKNNILNCNISLSSYWGILIACSSNNNVVGNDLNNNLVGLVVGGNLKEFWNQTIDPTNIINGKPVYYFFDLNNEIIEDLDTSHITLAWCTNISLKDCKVFNGDGLIIACTQNSVIEFCNFSKNSRGIWVDKSSNNTFTSCDISFNTWIGGLLMSDSFNNTVICCDLLSNSGDGIMLQGASNNTIANCTIYNTNNKGVFLAFSSNNNTIYHNNFINNTQNAYDECSNSWDNNYPSSGNYWSDYTGSDLYSGSGQNISGSDGIGDTPYNISGGSNQDHYPFMNQSGWEEVTGPVHNLGKDTYYQTIQAGVDDADPGNTIEVSAGTYYENVIIDKTLTLIGEDRNTTIIDGSGTGDVIYISADWVNVSEFGVRNSGGNYDDSGIEICSAYNRITSCVAYGNYWAGIYCSYFSSENIITNCIVYNNSEIGIGLYDSSENNQISNCTCYNNSNGIYLSSSSNNSIMSSSCYDNSFCGICLYAHSLNNQITNCICYNNSYDGIRIYSYSSNNQITNCICYNNSYSGIFVYSYSANNIITDCVFHNNSQGIYVDHYSSNNQILNSIFYNNFQGIYVCYSSNSTIGNCILYNNSKYGIELECSSNNSITNCQCYNNSNGTYLYYSPSNITNSTFHDNFGYGIYIDHSSENITNCTCYNNFDGIVFDYSSYNIITNCNIYSNEQYGIYFYKPSYNNTVVNCNISNNQYGIYLHESSNNNVIYHNNFVSNTNQAHDNCTNLWDNNYPSGGNYWSDYTGVDLFSGVNQDESGSDGIGDTPYNISGGSNQDRYPLMEPWNITVNQPPIVNITYPTEGQTVNGTIMITGTAYDPDSAVGVGKVHNLDKDTWYQTIQAAVDDADIGNRIFVYSGVYYENVVINKSLSLIGEDKETTIIDGNGSVGISVVFDFASGTGGWKTSIKNFTIINSTTAGIQFSSSDFNDVANCIIYSTKYGVYLYGGGYNIISKCNIFDNNIGINSEFSHSNSFTNCSIQSNSWDGIYLYSSSFNCIMNCSISNNYYAIRVMEYYYTSPSENNIIYHNNFINNTNQAYDECTNFWDNSSVGNHWSDYTGVDANGDGIGDTPYSIPGGTNKDRYPLMNPANITLGKYPQKNNQLDTDTNPQKNGISNGTTVQFVEIKIDSGSWQLATGTTSWSFAWDTTTVSNGWHTIYARAYDGIDYSEIKSVNVYVNNPISLPDLVIPAIIILPSETVSNGTYITINATVCNDGYGVVYNVTVEVYINDKLIHTEIIPAISPNTTAVVSTGWLAASIGNYTVRIVVDPENLINESNENNNEVIKTLIVTGIEDNIPPVISNIQANPQIQVINSWVNITCQVTDNVAVNKVGINTTGPGNFTYKGMMLRVTGTDIYYYNTTYSTLGIYNYLIWANDTSRNLAVSAGYQFEIITGNIPPIANFTYYQGAQALGGEYINVTLRVAGEKYRIVNLTVYENENAVGYVSVERVPGSPQEQQNTTSILINSSKLYNIALEYTADEKGSNPVWVIINYTGVRSFSYTYHMVFHENDTKALNLTEILETCARAIGLVKFDASASFDYDGWLTDWLWNFGDGATGQGKIIWHAYNTGSYTVTLAVTDSNYSSASATQNITILDYLGYFASARAQFGIALRCPADLTITNATGAFVGLNVSSGKHENWLLNAAMIISGDIEIYFVPSDINYTYTVRGLAPGDFTFLAYDPGAFEPGDFEPGDFPGRIYQIDSNVTSGSLDEIKITADGNNLTIKSDTDKFYSILIKTQTQEFAVYDIPINKNATHTLSVLNWSMIGDIGTASVNLSIDELSDGIVDRVEELWNNFNISDIFKPDLAIIEFEISKLQAKVGENITVRVTLKNLGNYPAKNIKVRFLVNNVSYGEDFEISLLARGASSGVIFYWHSDIEGVYVLSVCLDPNDTIKELREDNNLASDTVEIIKEAAVPSAPPALPSAAIIGGAIATTIVIAAALAGTEVGKYGFFSLFGPLFVKRKTAVLDQFTRGRIYNFIELNPGAHYNLIKSRLDISNGTLSYHLSLLEKEGYIKSETEGMYKRFYLTGKINAIEKAQLPLSDLQQDIVDLVRSSPGITQKEITVRTNKSRQIISYNIKVLTRVGIINKRKEGMKSRLYFEEKYT